MKKLLCISPHFPPVNAADMHRLRQSLPYFKEFNWNPVVFSVDPRFVEQSKEDLLVESVPDDIEIHAVKAFSTKYTRKIGLGNLGFRSWLQYKKAVNTYLTNNQVDLIYFSTTVFTLMSLGPYWKKRFNVPFVIDLQDPWRNDYYIGIPKKNRPGKFWFDYRQKKYLEAITMPKTSGIISVSDGYIETIKDRYPSLKSMQCLTLPFGALESDMDIAAKLDPVALDRNYTNVVYIGRGGNDMGFSLSALFSALRRGLDNNYDDFKKLRISFFGTSYAANGKGVKTITPLAKKYGVEQYVFESTDRLPYFQSLRTLQCADVLLIPGSIDENYTASKVFPYILSKRPLLAIFNKKSSVIKILQNTNAGDVVSFDKFDNIEVISNRIFETLFQILQKIPYEPKTNSEALLPYTAREMTKKQCLYFDSLML